MEFQQTQLRLNSAFRPETDGQTEKTNHFIADYLRTLVDPRCDNWDELLALAEFAYSSRVHSSTGMSPFVADIGYNPRVVSDLDLSPTSGRSSKPLHFLQHQQAILQ
jgi:hypothetical protein